MSTGERADGDVHYGDTTYIINVDALFGRLITRPPISSLEELEALRLPDGRYPCAATPQFLDEADMFLVCGRLIISRDAIFCLHEDLVYRRNFSYLTLAHAREVLRDFEKLDSSVWREVYASLETSHLRGAEAAKGKFLSEILGFRIMTEDVKVLMREKAEDVLPKKNPLACLRTRFFSRVSARDYREQGYQRMRVLMKRARQKKVTQEEMDEYADLRLETLALELLMEDPEWPQ